MSATGATEGKLTATGAIGGKYVTVVEKLVAMVKKLVKFMRKTHPTTFILQYVVFIYN